MECWSCDKQRIRSKSKGTIKITSHIECRRRWPTKDTVGTFSRGGAGGGSRRLFGFFLADAAPAYGDFIIPAADTCSLQDQPGYLDGRGKNATKSRRVYFTFVLLFCCCCWERREKFCYLGKGKDATRSKRHIKIRPEKRRSLRVSKKEHLRGKRRGDGKEKTWRYGALRRLAVIYSATVYPIWICFWLNWYWMAS